MGLFSRLKQAFSQPESEQSQASAVAESAPTSLESAATSVTAESATSQATSVADTSASVVTSQAATETSVSAASQSPASAASTAPVSATEEVAESVASQASTAPVSATEPTESTVASASSDASDADSHELTATESMAARIQSAQASMAQAAESVAAPTSDAVVPDSEASAIVEPASTAEETPVEATESTPESTAASEPEPEISEAQRYDEGLKKSRKTFGDRINAFLANFRHVDESFFDDLEDTLIESDVGYETAMRISEELRDEVKLQNAKSKKEISSVIVEKLVDMYGEAGEGEDNSIHLAKSGPTVILFVGVNGAGKTTTIGKMANMYKQQGKKVLLAACDTFRAGAIQQLQVWGQRDGVDVVAGPEKSDPASVCFDAVKKAKAEDYDILFVDTAGRLQNKVNLMNELEKIKRVITREIPDAPHEVLLVLDATTGQNALNQAKLFKQSTAVTGIVLTKLDGTARGGIVLAIRNELHLAVKYVGLGEKVTDLRPFNANDFVYGLFKDVITA
ncbi:signal recognition particle-docking protein FtsY [Lactiplantibacillus daowaiensis]|uniref:Signal recognition particle receptor FtsY n=1 Tax=Lactiplantibacillus daowaiensis TaxID=2559918 RepID=A0ABW1S3A9_9LACO